MTNIKSVARLFAMPALVFSLAACAVFNGQETTGRYIDDATITAKVKEAFIADAQIKSMQISVETMEGTVQLSGFVDSATTEARAVHVAGQVQGVKSVKDSLGVVTPAPK